MRQQPFIHVHLVPTLAVGVALVCGATTIAAENAAQPPAGAAVLARVPPKSPADALACFEVADGFRIELAAAEPLVVDPVAMAFDERGRLWVVEMCDYSEQDKERLGQVRILTDDDGDGRFDRSQVFVERLSWPTAIACWNGGVFIGAAPDILYCKDTNGDGRADEQRVVFTGFGRGNVQGLLNSFQWGLDNRIHGATSSAGGLIMRPGVKAAPLELRGRDFSFDPRTLDITATTGGGQHGMSFNRWGDRFACSNSDHLQAIVFEERYLRRNPLQSVAAARRSIAADGPQGPVFRTSPVEAWRIARTKMRVAGLAPGPVEGGGQPAGYFTSATGVTIYEGGLWDAAGPAWAIVADVGSNLVHRKRLAPDGITYRGERVDSQSEFIRSSDIWFRPVQFAIGPEGALYIADMYREVIEHPASLPEELKRQLDLTSGRDRGRIYRVVPADYKQTAPRPLDEPLEGATIVELVAALDHPNMWRRMTALRLLDERQDESAANLLREQYAKCRRPEGRIAVLYAMSSLGVLGEDDLLAAVGDSYPQVRRHAIRLAEPRLDQSARLFDAVLALALAHDHPPIVEFQLALTLGESRDPRAAEALAQSIIRNVDDADLCDAALTSLGHCAGGVLRTLVAADPWHANPRALAVIESLVRQILAQQNERDLGALNGVLLISEGRSGYRGRYAIVRTLARTPASSFARAKSPLMAELAKTRDAAVRQLLSDARHVLERDAAQLDDRLEAIANLGLDSFEAQRATFEELLSPQQPAAIHSAVLAACANYDAPEVAEMVLSQWGQFAPAERTAAVELLLRRREWAAALLAYLADEGVALATLDPGHVARLENYPSPEVNRRARELRGQGVGANRKQVFDDYRSAMKLAGEPSRGRLVFEKSCATCHQLAATGSAVGPNLVAMANRGAESLLFNVLVPNGEVDPRYLEYVVLTADGQVVTGIIAGETSTAVTLRGADGKSTTLLRVDIDEMTNTGKSLMPEGFERLIDQQAMADLLAYLVEAAATEGVSP